MEKYTRDGGVIPDGIPTSYRSHGSHYSKFGLFKGQINKVIYPEEDNNINSSRVEYVLKVNGQIYPNAVDMRKGGGIHNYQERILKPIERSYTGEISDKVYEEELDGEIVYVLFLNGNGDFPIIIGCAEHPKNVEYRSKTKKEDGVRTIEEFNGVEFHIDKDSNLSFTHVGRKNPKDDSILNPEAVGTYFKMYGNGDVELNVYGKDDDQPTDLRVFFNKELKKIEVYAQENSVVIDDIGIKLTDKNTNFIEMKANTITVKESNGGTLKIGSDKVGLGGSSAELLQQISDQLEKLATLFQTVAPHTHIGNLGYPTASPDTQSAWETAKADMNTIKGKIDGIKGGI